MGLLEELRENKGTRMLFGKKELLIIEKQLLGVSLKPSEKTRLSRDIRKKFQAIASLAPFQKKFSLKHRSTVNEIVQDSVEFIRNSTQSIKIKKIILFGSTVEKSRTLLSDIDLAVEFSSISEKEAIKFRLEIMRKLHKSVDLQVYNILPEKIKKRIEIYGKTVYQREN
ncbi:MAG: nucleotidyltransferase domain-containing protein [Nanoarchaeota archaeon]